MNLQLHHKASQFDETHPQTLKELPLTEEFEAEVLPGHDSAIIRFRVPAKEKGHFVAILEAPLLRVEKYFLPRGQVRKLIGRWKRVKGGKQITEDAAGVKHEEITYDANYFVFEGEGSTLAMRMQTLEDERKIAFCPQDQQREFKVMWTGEVDKSRGRSVEMSIVLSNVRIAGMDPLEDEILRLSALDVADLQTLAPQVGVKWDDKASTDTMVRKMAEKRLKAKQPKPTPELAAV